MKKTVSKEIRTKDVIKRCHCWSYDSSKIYTLLNIGRAKMQHVDFKNQTKIYYTMTCETSDQMCVIDMKMGSVGPSKIFSGWSTKQSYLHAVFKRLLRPSPPAKLKTKRYSKAHQTDVKKRKPRPCSQYLRWQDSAERHNRRR